MSEEATGDVTGGVTWSDIMELGGRYAELVTLQASAYLAPESS